MNAAAAKTQKDESSLLTTKGKSSWSGSLSTPRKSLENLFKSTEMSLGTCDSYIRPRKTFDDQCLNYGQSTSKEEEEEQQQTDENKQGE